MVKRELFDSLISSRTHKIVDPNILLSINNFCSTSNYSSFFNIKEHKTEEFMRVCDFLWFHVVVGPGMDYGSSWGNVDLQIEKCGSF